MADRSIRLYLRAEIADFKRQMAEAARAAEEPGRKSRETSERSQTALGRMVQSAHENRQAWTTAGQALTAVGAATGALYASALKTGIAYNTLQQTSRAALATMLGGTQAANMQMDKLDEWARNSPFAKQIFIDAQRQLLGFGMSAERVIPTLDAIQNAVAAMGGNNQDIAEITNILAQVEGQGKITGRELQRLGLHGLNAADLIGEQMGKSGAEIRDQITRGTLDARTALDALTAGMQERFGGAADNVKNTFEGAVDRVKAAWRDLSSELAEPLVGAEGGGLLIDLANNAADAMRWFQQLPEPIKQTVAALGGLVAVGGTLGGVFLMLTPRILENVRAVQLLAKEHPRAVRAIKGAGWAAVAATIVSSLDQWADSIRKARNGGEADLGALATSLSNFAHTGKVAGEAARYFGEDFADLDDAFGKTSGWASNLGRINNNLGSWGHLLGPLKGMTQQWAANVKDGDEKLEAFDQTLKQLVSAGDLETAAALQANFAARAAEAGWSVEQIDAALSEYRVALEDAKGATEGAASATGELAEETANAEAAAQAAEDAYAEWHSTVENAARSFVDVVDAYDQVIEANIELARATAEATGDAESSWEDFYDGATVKPKEWIKSLRDQVAEQRAWADNLVAAATKVREELPPELQEAGQALVDDFIAKGPEGADALAAFVEMKPKQRQKIVELTDEAAKLATGNLQEQLTDATDPYVTLDVKLENAEWQIDNFIRETQARELNLNLNILGRRISAAPSSNLTPRMASGGPVRGPGTGTSDSIPALLSNGEHVVTAREVQGAGGHSVLERFRAMARAGALPAFASGGRVGWARERQREAREALREARQEAKAARQAVRAAERTYQGIDSGRAGQAQRNAARRDLERARKAQRQADNAVRDAERGLRDAQARTQRLRTQRRELRTDLRRGTIRDAVTGGGGLRIVDDLLEQSRNTDLSKKQRNRLADTAKESEKALSRLYKQSEKVEERLAAARDRVAELGQIAGQVSGRLSGEQSLADAIVRGETSTDAYGRQSTTADTVSSRGLVAAAKAKASKIRAFAGKLQKLQKLGLSGVVLQEIAMLGSEEGSLVADAMIAGGKSDINALNAAYADIAKWSDQAGQYVTEGFYKGGLSAAEGLVKGLEDQQAAIEKQMLKIAKSMEKALKKALGIKSPSTKAREWMHDVGAGAELGLDDARRGIESKMNSVGVSALAALQDVSDPRRGSAVPASVAPVIDLSNLSVEVTMTTDRKFAAAIWRQGGQEVARTDRAVVRGIVGAS